MTPEDRVMRAFGWTSRDLNAKEQWMVRDLLPRMVEVVSSAEAEARRAGAEEEAARWREAIVPGQADTWTGRTMRTPGDARLFIEEMRKLTRDEGAAEMRERAAKAAEDWRKDEPDRVCCMGRHEKIAAAIRALPLLGD